MRETIRFRDPQELLDEALFAEVRRRFAEPKDPRYREDFAPSFSDAKDDKLIWMLLQTAEHHARETRSLTNALTNLHLRVQAAEGASEMYERIIEELIAEARGPE